MTRAEPRPDTLELGKPLVDSAWPLPPIDLTLTRDEVHIWRAPLDLEPARIRRLRWMLTDEERDKADRLRATNAYRAFVVSRAALRDILSRYLHADPRAIAFRLGPFGKPELGEDFADPPMRFNLSHSHELSLLAFTLGREVGVDLERIRHTHGVMEMAERFCSSSEFLALQDLSNVDRQQGFFSCWTRKEAYVKARGAGLTIPLDSFSVSVVPGETRISLDTGEPRGSKNWSLYALEPGPNYIAALAVEGTPKHFRHWSWSRLAG